MLLAALGLLPLAAGMYYSNSTAYSSGALGQFVTQSYQSSNYTPVAINFIPAPPSLPASTNSTGLTANATTTNSTSSNSTSPGYLFLAPRGTPVPQAGALILDDQGGLIWDGSQYGQTMAYSVQTYMGQKVIAIWVGQFNAGGYGNGHQLLLNETYAVVANVSTPLANQTNDFHEFGITTNNTALITVYDIMQYDLSSYGVSTTDGSQGWILGGYAQEINITTGETIFTWSSLDHVDPSMSYASPGATGGSESNAWDYFHINSIDKDDMGNYLISSRHCHALYYVSGVDGSILWTINGMNSSFAMGAGSTFEWQHHARWENNGTQITLFDNAATDWTNDEPQARGLLLDVDQANMTVNLAVQMLPPTGNYSESQGSVQLQPNGNYLVGWGQQAWYSEYSPNGTLLYSAQFGIGNSQATQDYRVLRYDWAGSPSTNPNVSVITNSTASTYDVYVSWNGATQVSYWSLLGAASTNGTTAGLGNANRTDFETMISVAQNTVSSAGYTYLQMAAMDAGGSVLGYSDYLTLNGTVSGSPAAAESSSIALPSSSSTAASSGAVAVASSTAKVSGGERRLGLIGKALGVLVTVGAVVGTGLVL